MHTVFTQGWEEIRLGTTAEEVVLALVDSWGNEVVSDAGSVPVGDLRGGVI